MTPARSTGKNRASADDLPRLRRSGARKQRSFLAVLLLLMLLHPRSQDVGTAEIADDPKRIFARYHRQPADVVGQHLCDGIMQGLVGKGHDDIGFTSGENIALGA